MPLIDVEQQSEDWLKMRVGMCTASRVCDVVKKLKRASGSRQAGDPAATRDEYLMEVVCERLTGRAADHFVTQWMEQGIENEPFARAAYEIATDCEVQPGGFAIHPDEERFKGWFGASPDGLVGTDGLVEIKCLKSENHLEIVSNGVVPAEFLDQMYAEMSCAERQWGDFISFDPRMPKDLQLFIARLPRNEEKILVIEAEVQLFLEDVILRLGEFARKAKDYGNAHV